MKYLLGSLGTNLVALVCVGASTYLAINGKEGWGWFLFAAICCASSASFGNSHDEEEKDEE